MRSIIVRLHLLLVDPLHRDEGQTSAEYALVVLGAAGVALLVGAWAHHTGKITDLLDALFDAVTKHVR
jgi:hypothetical protein